MLFLKKDLLVNNKTATIGVIANVGKYLIRLTIEMSLFFPSVAKEEAKDFLQIKEVLFTNVRF